MSATSLLNPKAESLRRGEALRVNIAAGEGTPRSRTDPIYHFGIKGDPDNCP
jgi:hypothetical protein